MHQFLDTLLSACLQASRRDSPGHLPLDPSKPCPPQARLDEAHTCDPNACWSVQEARNSSRASLPVVAVALSNKEELRLCLLSWQNIDKIWPCSSSWHLGLGRVKSAPINKRGGGGVQAHLSRICSSWHLRQCKESWQKTPPPRSTAYHHDVHLSRKPTPGWDPAILHPWQVSLSLQMFLHPFALRLDSLVRGARPGTHVLPSTAQMASISSTQDWTTADHP